MAFAWEERTPDIWEKGQREWKMFSLLRSFEEMIKKSEPVRSQGDVQFKGDVDLSC